MDNERGEAIEDAVGETDKGNVMDEGNIPDNDKAGNDMVDQLHPDNDESGLAFVADNEVDNVEVNLGPDGDDLGPNDENGDDANANDVNIPENENENVVDPNQDWNWEHLAADGDGMDWFGFDVDSDFDPVDYDSGPDVDNFEDDEDDDIGQFLFQHYHPDMDGRPFCIPKLKDKSNCEPETILMEDLMVGYKLLTFVLPLPRVFDMKFQLVGNYLQNQSWIKMYLEFVKLKSIHDITPTTRYYFLIPFGLQLLKAAIDLRYKTIIKCLLSVTYCDAYTVSETFSETLLLGNMLMPFDHPNAYHETRYAHNECLTPLMYAYMIGHTDMMELLIELGALRTEKGSRYLQKDPAKPLSLTHDVNLMFLAIVNSDAKMIDYLLMKGVRPRDCCVEHHLRNAKSQLHRVEVPLWAVALEMADLRLFVHLLAADIAPEVPSYPLSKQLLCQSTDLHTTIDAYAMSPSSTRFRVATLLYMAGFDGVAAQYMTLKVQYEELFDPEEMTDTEREEMSCFLSVVNNARPLAVLTRNAVRDAIARRGEHIPTCVGGLHLARPQVDLVLCRDLLQYV